MQKPWLMNNDHVPITKTIAYIRVPYTHFSADVVSRVSKAESQLHFLYSSILSFLQQSRF